MPSGRWRARGVTLGHFPQSFEYATIGGFAATRSAGQASSGYGRFDALVTLDRPDGAGGGDPNARDAPHARRARRCVSSSIGSEGALGRDHRGDRPGPAGAGSSAATRSNT